MRIIKKISAQSGLACINRRCACAQAFRAALSWLVSLMVLWGQMSAYAATPPNTELLNTVFVEYQVGEGAPVNTQATERTVTTSRTPAQIDFYTVFEDGDLTDLPGTDYSRNGTDANPQWEPLAHDLAPAVPVTPASSFSSGETLLVRVEDFDQNIDATVRETIVVTLETGDGDTEVLRLTETAPDSGVFLGVILTNISAANNVFDGTLQVASATEVTAFYRDGSDVTDTAAAAIMIDPVSLVFDSITGEPISGVEIKLIHDKSGLAARAYDTDGSDWPNPVISGSAVSARFAAKSPRPLKGEFRFPRVPAGEYRLEVIPPPGYRYPSQQSNTQLSVLGAVADKVIIGSRGERFELDKALDSIELHVPLDPFTGRFSVSKTVMQDVAAVGDIVKYSIVVRNQDPRYPLYNVKLLDTLPPGFRYVHGSARYENGEVFPAENIHVDGRQLHFKPGQLAAGQTITLSYMAHVGTGSMGSTDTAVNQVQGFSDDAVSNIARAEVRLLNELMTDKGLIIGRVFSGTCDDPEQQTGIRAVRLYLENGRSVVTDKHGRWHMAGVRPGTHVVQLDTISIPDGYMLAPCEMTARNAGKEFAQWVDVTGGDIRRVDYRLQPDGTGSSTVASAVANTGITQPDDPLDEFDNDYVAQATPGFEIVWPPERYVPAISSVKIAVKYQPQHQLKILLNGSEVSALNFKGNTSNKAKTVAVARWSGVDIKQKHNVLTAVLSDKSGREIGRLEREVHFTERSVKATLVPGESRLIADGKQRPVIALRLEDEDGFTPRPRTHGYFSLEHTHWAPVQTAASPENVALNTRRQNGRYEYTVSNDGLVRIELEPTARSGEVVLNVALSDGETAEVRAWLKPALRDWIMVGFAKGTLGYKTLSGNLQTLSDVGEQEGYYRKGQLSFFAKGRVRGDYLLTVAYDSAKQADEVGAQLQGNIDPDGWYTLYADHQAEQYEAPSSSKLYLRLERGQFFALFGDYHTDLDVTELSNYERVLHGLKSEYKGDNISYKVFASQTGNQRQIDEIAPDGTSGLYELSYVPVANSEKIVLETRDRDHPEVVVTSRALSRHVDYEIDYLQRSLFFKFPVSAMADDFNPVLIVASYEIYAGKAGKELTAGGRIAYTSDDKRFTVGASYLREGEEDQQYGIDARYKLSENLTLRAEAAQSGMDEEKAQAWLAEADYVNDELSVRAYGREKEKDFGLQQDKAGQSMRKLGLETRYALALDSVLSFDVNHQFVPGLQGAADTERLQSHIQWEKEFDSSQFSFGVRHTEEDSDIGHQHNRQITVGGRTRLFDDKLTVSAKLEKSLLDETRHSTPDRARLGLDYQLNENTELVLEQEWSQAGDEQADQTRLGLRAKPWSGGRLHSGLVRDQKVGINSIQRDYANFGLSQQWQVNENLSLDVGVDKVKTLRQSHILATEGASGIPDNGDYTSFSLGAGWNDEHWSAAGRLEYFTGELSDKTSLTLGAVRELSDDHALAANLRIIETEFNNGDRTRKSEVGLHMAARPEEQGNWFNRLDLSDETKFSGGVETSSRKMVNNLHYIRPLGEAAEFSFHHGIKLGLTENDTGSYRSLLDTMQAAVRLDINEHWDAGLQGGYLHNWESHTWNYFSGLSVGFNPATNTRVEVGYNLTGFEDEDFASGHYTSQGPYVDFNYKLDQDLMQELKTWSER